MSVNFTSVGCVVLGQNHSTKATLGTDSSSGLIRPSWLGEQLEPTCSSWFGPRVAGQGEAGAVVRGEDENMHKYAIHLLRR